MSLMIFISPLWLQPISAIIIGAFIFLSRLFGKQLSGPIRAHTYAYICEQQIWAQNYKKISIYTSIWTIISFFLYFVLKINKKAATTYCHHCQITVIRRAEVNTMSKNTSEFESHVRNIVTSSLHFCYQMLLQRN